LNVCNSLINKGKEPIAILQGIASILRDLVITKVTEKPTNLCNISQENSETLNDLATSVHLNQLLNLQAKLKGSESNIRNSNQPNLWLEIHLLGMLSDQDSKENNRIKQSLIKTKISENSEPKNLNSISKNIDLTPEKELIKKTDFRDETETSPTLNLDDMWKKVIAMLELPSTKMLLSQQAKLINLNSDSAEIAISEKWINMIQSRKNLIEDAFYKARGSSTKVLLIQQKDKLSNHKEVEKSLQKIKPSNQIKTDRDASKNTFKEEKIEPKNNLEVNSIDQKAKQFADFFNGEIVNLE
jgi:DNA polymerase-3 subunit gamma/tau